ncbi:MAG: metal ABC transporter substrate-binding protein [bacterium]
MAASTRDAHVINKKTAIIKVPILIALTFMTAFIGLSHPPVCLAGQKLRVVTSLFPLQEMARAVGGDRASVDLLLPPGAEPHAWEPKPGDIATLTRADIFIYLGAGMEPWVHDLLKGINRPSLKVIEASHGLSVIDSDHEEETEAGEGKKDHHHGPMDPHLWLDFSYDQIMVSQIARAFSEHDPAGAAVYSQNAAQYQKKLAELDRKYQKGLHNCSSRKIIIGGHSAFAYLAKRYHLEQITLYGISPDAEPSPKKLAETVDLARKLHIKTIFFEELISDRMARVLAQEVGAATLTLNPGANLTGEQVKAGVSFLSLMEKNLETLRKGLLCE